MDFLTALKGPEKTAYSNVTYTENMAKTYKSTIDPNVDFFGLAGAMRKNPDEAVRLFQAAYAEDKQLAVRTIFYLRDIRGGQGERALFRAFLSSLYDIDAEVADGVLKFIPTYGRWDDLPLTDASIALIRSQFDLDEIAMEKGESISLMAKWLPSENSSSKKSKENARKLASLLGLSSSEYRRKVVKLRKYIKLLEQQMSAKDWDIDYSKLPSQALRKHTKAFRRNDPEGYSTFLTKVEKGEVKINTSTLFTYEVMKVLRSDAATADAMWNNLPDYTQGKNALVIADVSGSMGTWGYGDHPINVSVSLALYFAERNQGAFNGYWMNFSSRSELIKVTGKTLQEKIQNISMANWGGSTNVEAAFKQILDAALASNAKTEEIPSTLYIISDMEFNYAANGTDITNFENAKKMFANAGYLLPHVVFWNVQARNTQVPALAADGNVTLISGLSQSTFRYALENKTPRDSMLAVLNSERYAQIVL